MCFFSMVGPLIWESENLSAFREMESCSLFGGPPTSPALPVGVEQRRGMSHKEEGIFVSDYSPAQAVGPWVFCRQLPQELLWAWWESDQCKGCGIEGGGLWTSAAALGGAALPFPHCEVLLDKYLSLAVTSFDTVLFLQMHHHPTAFSCTSGNESLYFRNLFFTEKYPVKSWRPASS